MAVIALTSPYSLNDATLTIGVDDYTAAVSQVEFAPSTSQTSWRGIGGNVIRDQAVSEWVCNLAFAQDLSPTGLLRYLLDNEGDKVEATFTPKAGGPSIEATIVIAPATIGGTADGNVTTVSVSLAVDGKPAFVDLP